MCRRLQHSSEASLIGRADGAADGGPLTLHRACQTDCRGRGQQQCCTAADEQHGRPTGRLEFLEQGQNSKQQAQCGVWKTTNMPLQDHHASTETHVAMLLSPHHPCFTSQLELPTTSPPLFRALTLALPSLCFCFLLCLRLRLQARALLEPGSQEGSSEIVSDEDTQPSRQLVRLGRAIWRPRVVLLLLDFDLDRARVRIRVGSGQGRALHAPTPSE